MNRVRVYAISSSGTSGTEGQTFFEPGLVIISGIEIELDGLRVRDLERDELEVVALIADALFLDGLPCPKHGSDEYGCREWQGGRDEFGSLDDYLESESRGSTAAVQSRVDY